MRCKACGLKHQPWVRCEIAKALAGQDVEVDPGQAGKDASTPPSNEGHASGLAPAVKKARDFLKKVGRPKVVQDFKAHRREYMKGWRARQK